MPLSIASAADDLQRLSWTLRRKPLESFLAPQAAVPMTSGGGALVCRDGSLVSLIGVEGARSMTGAEELDRFVDIASRRLNSAFAAPGHALHVAFERATDEAGGLADAHAGACRSQAARLGLDLDDLLAERARRLGPLMAAETLVLACWTRPSVLPKERLERGRKALRRRLRDWLPEAGEAQCPHLALDGLWPRHEALLDTMEALLAEAGIVAARLSEEDEALRDGAPHGERRGLHRAGLAPGDGCERCAGTAHGAARGRRLPAAAGARSCWSGSPSGAGPGIRIGGRLYGALDMCLGPRHARPFSELMAGLAAAGLRPEGLPCRFSLLIEGGGLHRLDAAVARVASSFLAFSSADSLLCRNALRDLAAMGADAQAVVRLRLGLLTWVAAEEGTNALAARLGRLQQLAEGWGEPAFTPLVGDPLESLAASVPGFCCGGTAEPALAPLTEALRLMPVSRPAPLGARSGTLVPETLVPQTGHLFRSVDGKPLPLAADEGGDYGFELIYGLPGQGKSVLMNALGLAFSLQEGQARLPLSAVIDIGPSSSGLVSLVREALPPARRHEAGWFPLRMTSAHAINPCDTQLGCRSPLPAERAFLTNLLSLMVTPADPVRGSGAGVPDGMRELIGPTVTCAYALRSDKAAGGEPNAYTQGRDGEVDAAIATLGLRLPDRAVWWDAVDMLFEAGAPEAAARAQRYAVPTLVDLLASVREPAVQGLVGDARYGSGGETVTQAFIRILTSLSGQWPVMFAPTAFDVGGARLAAIDLAEVAPQGSGEADRQSAAFYLLARHALTRHWWIGEDALASIPEPYREWHSARLRDIREAPKRLCYDEFHRTAGAPAVRAQVERDVREARKLRVRLALASQRLEDFGGALAELANRYWILGAGGKAREEETLSELFALSETLSDAVRYRLTGPGKDGAPALLIAAGQGGRFEQLLVNTPGPVELWALTTSPQDEALRRKLYARLAPDEARRALARAFPEGSAKGRIERELARFQTPVPGAAASEEAVLDRLADEVAAATGNDLPHSIHNTRHSCQT